MQICITQRAGVRHFSKFKNIPERDRLEIELTVDDERQKVFIFDLTEAMFEQFAKHPEILGKRVRRAPEYEAPKPSRTRKMATKKTAPVAETVPEQPKTTKKAPSKPAKSESQTSEKRAAKSAPKASASAEPKSTITKTSKAANTKAAQGRK